MTDFRDRLRNPGCQLCPLHAAAEHVCLMGSGPTRARVMVVGEAPGAREDDEHRAFVGPAGKLLDRSLRELAGLERDEVYVTNVAKCRPPENRTPTRKEAKTCVAEYLWEEVKAVRPEYMLLLGNAPLQAVLGKSGIMKQHGTVTKRVIDGLAVTIMTTIHPAAVLRNPNWAEPFGMDMHRFGRMLRGEATSPTTRVLLVKTRRQLRILSERLLQADEVTWDIETYTRPADPPYVRTNLQDWHEDDSLIVTMSFTWEVGLSVVVPIHHHQSPWKNPAAVQDWLLRILSHREVIGHNLKYDARWAASKGWPLRQGFCTMLAAHMLDENRSKGLKNLSRTVLGADAYDVGEELKDAYHMDLTKLAIYNGKDTDYTHRLRRPFQEELEKIPRLNTVFRELMMPASQALVDIERVGVYLDPERWRERYDEAQERQAALFEYMNRWVPEDLRPINLNSPQQVGRWLYDHLGLPVLERTKTGAASTREGVLLRLAKRHKATTAMIKYRKWAKYLNTYLGPWWYEHRDAGGRIHSNYKLFGTVTGRLSGEGGIQQVPRDSFIRSILGAAPGWVFVQADYSQVELRIAAMLANEKKMLRQYIRGEDIHMIRAMRMTGKLREDVEKEERKKAKAVNFGYIYGMSAGKFATYAFENYDLEITEEEAQRDRELFFEDYPALRPWHERQRRLARRYRQVVSPIGRVRHLSSIMSQDKDVRAEAERQAINSPVQSLASDLMLFSLIRLHALMPPDEARIVGTVHDSILFEIRPEWIHKWCPTIKLVMEDMDRVRDTFGCEITVPIVADIELGDHWGEGVPYEPAK